MAVKKKSRTRTKVAAVDPKSTVNGFLGCSASTFDADELALAEQFAKQVSELLRDRSYKVAATCSMMQRNNAPTEEPEWRRLSMVGDEQLQFDSAYFGKRQGMILVFKAITVPLGLKASDLEMLRLEANFKQFKDMLVDIESGMRFYAHLKTLIDLDANPLKSIEDLKERAAEMERSRLRREASVKIETYGSNWGAF